jgi:hypothetical protein
MTAPETTEAPGRANTAGASIVLAGMMSLLIIGPLGPVEAGAQGSFEVLSPPPGYESAWAQAISSDGSTVMGSVAAPDDGPPWRIVVWRVDGTVDLIGPPAGFDGLGTPLGLSADGSTAYFTAFRSGETGRGGLATARWTLEEGSVDMSSAIGDESFHPYLLAADGRTLVGEVGPYVEHASGFTAGRLAFWSEESGLDVVDGEDAVGTGWPAAVSRDGSTTAGTFLDGSAAGVGQFAVQRSGQTRPIWVPDFPLGGQEGIGTALSTDGDAVYGMAWLDASHTRVCLYAWPTAGDPVCLDETDGSELGRFRISTPSEDDSRLLIHANLYFGSDRPFVGFVWDADGGLRELGHFLAAEQGLDLGDLSSVSLGGQALSADGRVIVGHAWIDSTTLIPWRAILAPRCADGFDNDGDGAVDFPDDPGCGSADDPDDTVREDAAIDIEPYRDPNTLVIDRPGIVTVAILGSHTFHVADVDTSALRLGPGEARPRIDLDGPGGRARRTVDVNRDGHDDLLLRFATGSLSLTLEDRSVCLQGTAASDAFEACDDIVPVLGRFGCGEGFALAFLAPVAVRLGRRRCAPRG